MSRFKTVSIYAALGVLAQTQAHAHPYQIGKSYWFQPTCLASSTEETVCIQSIFRAKVYGYGAKHGTPLLEVETGVYEGMRNACYENPSAECSDSSNDLVPYGGPFYTGSTSLSLTTEQLLQQAHRGTIQRPWGSDTCVQARMIELDSDSLTEFMAGQYLVAPHGVRYDANLNGILQRMSGNQIPLREHAHNYFGVHQIGCGLQDGEEVEVYGKERVGGSTYYVGSVHAIDPVYDVDLSDYFVYLSPEIVRLKDKNNPLPWL